MADWESLGTMTPHRETQSPKIETSDLIRDPYQDTTSEAYFQRQKAAADRILCCDPRDFARILNTQEEAPMDKRKVRSAFESLSNLLSPECNLGRQYDGAQDAHDSECEIYLEALLNVNEPGLWVAARWFEIDMSDYYNSNDRPPLFSMVDPSPESRESRHSVQKRTADMILSYHANDHHLILGIRRLPEYAGPEDGKTIRSIQNNAQTALERLTTILVPTPNAHESYHLAQDARNSEPFWPVYDVYNWPLT